MISVVWGFIVFLCIVFVGFYLTCLYIYKDEKNKSKKAWKDIEPFIRKAIALIGPWLIVWVILLIIF